jgi:DNA-directed RNA polymerase specialized sigma24 family protein
MDEIKRESYFHSMKIRTSANVTPEIQGAKSFDELFVEHWARVYDVLVRLVGDPAEAEDLALETFLPADAATQAALRGAG